MAFGLNRGRRAEVVPVHANTQMVLRPGIEDVSPAEAQGEFRLLSTAEKIILLKDLAERQRKDAHDKSRSYGERIQSFARIHEADIVNAYQQSEAFYRTILGHEKDYIQLDTTRQALEDHLAEQYAHLEQLKGQVLGSLALVGEMSQQAVDARQSRKSRSTMQFENLTQFGVTGIGSDNPGRDLVSPARERATEVFQHAVDSSSEVNRDIRETALRLESVNQQLRELDDRIGINVWSEYAHIRALYQTMVYFIQQDALFQKETADQTLAALSGVVPLRPASEAQPFELENLLGVQSSAKVIEQPETILLRSTDGDRG